MLTFRQEPCCYEEHTAHLSIRSPPTRTLANRKPDEHHHDHVVVDDDDGVDDDDYDEGDLPGDIGALTALQWGKTKSPSRLRIFLLLIFLKFFEYFSHNLYSDNIFIIVLIPATTFAIKIKDKSKGLAKPPKVSKVA